MYIKINDLGSKKESSFKNYKQLQISINNLNYKYLSKRVNIYCYDLENEYQKYCNACKDLIKSASAHPKISKLRNVKRLVANYNKNLAILEKYRSYFIIIRESKDDLRYKQLVYTYPEYRIFRFIDMYKNQIIKSPAVYLDKRINKEISDSPIPITECIIFPKTWDFTQLNMYFILQKRDTLIVRICK